MRKNNKGITLIALVVTIIVLLILAGVSIITLTGDNGIITRTAEAKQKTEEKGIDEQVKLAVMASIANDKYAVDGTMLEEALTNSFGEDGYTLSGNSSSGWKITVGDYSYKINSKGEIKEAVTSVKIKDVDGTVQNVTKSDLANYYGKKVDYSAGGATFRIFYIDFDGKYGDPGIIYLKADYSDSRTTNLNLYASYNPTTTKVREMNPSWAEGATSSTDSTKRGYAESKWNANEQAAAYLCTPETSAEGTLPWSSYYTSDANFVIGSPSAEMYCDSYSQVPHTGKDVLGDDVTGNYSFEAVYSYSNCPGYKYQYTDLSVVSPSPVTEFYTPYIGNGSLDFSTKYNNMYCGKLWGNKGGNWWLASPSAITTNHVCHLGGNDPSLRCELYSNAQGLCPLVSLRSNVIPEVLDN